MDKNISPGILRMQYLDIATKSLADNDFNTTSLYIDSFLVWIREESDESKDLNDRFSVIESECDSKIQSRLKDLEERHLNQIEINELLEKEAAGQMITGIKKKLDACVQVCFKHGLFND